MTSTADYTVSGMTCAHCESAVRSEVSELPGIQNVTVSAATGVLRVTATGPINDTAVLAAVDEAGYQAVRA